MFNQIHSSPKNSILVSIYDSKINTKCKVDLSQCKKKKNIKQKQAFLTTGKNKHKIVHVGTNMIWSKLRKQQSISCVIYHHHHNTSKEQGVGGLSRY